jgi:hypothetical protein
MAAEAARALNRLGRGHRSWDSLGGDPSSGQYVGRLTATFAVACVGAQRSQSTSLCRLGVETRGGRCGLAWSGASNTVPRPLPNPSSLLTIHRFRDPRAGDAYVLVLAMWWSATEVLGEVIVDQAADIRCAK